MLIFVLGCNDQIINPEPHATEADNRTLVTHKTNADPSAAQVTLAIRNFAIQNNASSWTNSAGWQWKTGGAFITYTSYEDIADKVFGVSLNTNTNKFTIDLTANNLSGPLNTSALKSVSSVIEYYVPLKCNRLVDDSDAKQPYQRIDALHLTEETEQRSGKRVKLHKFPRVHKVKVFRVASSHRTDSVATNDLSQSDVSVVRRVCDVRWKIEQLHREAKQLTGLENCQCRLPRIVRNHIAAAFLVWVHLMRKAYETGKTLYQVKHGLLSEYLCQQLKSSAI